MESKYIKVLNYLIFVILFFFKMEKRFCINCMLKTSHEFVDDEPDIIYTYKRKRLYKCLNCGYFSKKRGLRPSSESVY